MWSYHCSTVLLTRQYYCTFSPTLQLYNTVCCTIQWYFIGCSTRTACNYFMTHYCITIALVSHAHSHRFPRKWNDAQGLCSSISVQVSGTTVATPCFNRCQVTAVMALELLPHLTFSPWPRKELKKWPRAQAEKGPYLPSRNWPSTVPIASYSRTLSTCMLFHKWNCQTRWGKRARSSKSTNQRTVWTGYMNLIDANDITRSSLNR